MKFDVTGYVTEEFTLLEVEAESEEEARTIAIARVQSGENHLLSGTWPEVDVWNVVPSDE